MTNSLTRNIFALFLLSALLVAGTNAELSVSLVSHDTDVQSTYNNLKACSCGGEVDAIHVKNLGDLDSNYAFEIQSDQPWFTLDRTSAWLKAGDSMDVYVFTNAPCGAAGSGEYTVYVSSEYGRYRAIEKTVQVGVCENIYATITPTATVLAPCQSAPFTLNITNVATFTETYSVDYLGFPSVTIPAGQTRTLSGSYTAACNEWGNKTIPVAVHSTKNGLSQSLPVQITVLRAYDYQLELDQTPSPVCAGVTTMIPVHVTNLEDRANTIDLTLLPDGNKTTIGIGPNASRHVSLPFTPTRVGERAFTIRATGENGTINKETSLTVPVEACYGFAMDAPSVINACPGSIAVPFTITSAGSRTQGLDLAVRSNTTTSVDDLSATVHTNEIITKSVHAIIPDADRDWYVTLSASSAFANAEKTTLIHGYSTEACYRVAPVTHQFSVWTDQDILPVIIHQTGIQPATYEVTYNGTFARPLETELTLAPDQTAILHMQLNATGRQTGRYVDRLTLSANGVNYVTDFGINLRQKGFWQHFTDACRADDAFAVCSVTSTLALLILLATILFVAAIIARTIRYENPRGRFKERWLTIGGLVLAVLLVVMLFTAPTIPRSYERPIGPSNASDLQFQIGEGQALTIDLNGYFTDPDMDSLHYTASQSDHLDVEIHGHNATITARNGQASIDYLVFTANDGRGGITDSNVFTISVVPYRPVSLLEYWLRGCWFMTSLFLFVAIAMLLLVVLFSPTKRERPIQATTTVSSDTALVDANGRPLVEIEGAEGRPLTRLERDVLQQAQTLVNAEQIIINQGKKDETVFVASTDGKRFHKSNCPVVRNLSKSKRVTFKTREAAVQAGYSPCKTCSSHQ